VIEKGNSKDLRTGKRKNTEKKEQKTGTGMENE